MLFGWDIGSIGGIIVMEAFKAEYNITPKIAATLNSNIVSTLQGGCFFGSLIAYYIADKWGRRPSLLLAAGVTCLGVTIQCATKGHLDGLYVGRLVAGFGVGAASMLTPLYVSENAPRAIRGGLTGLYQLFIATGVMLSFWVNYGCYRNFKPKTTNTSTWLVPLALQAIPALCLFVGVFFCNESPRWLAKTDNWEKATEVLSRITNLPRDHPYVQMELDEMRVQLDNERRLIGGASFWDLQREMWTIKGNRNRALISIGLMVCQQMTGTNAINYYAPLIFRNLGIVGTDTGLFATGIYGVVKMVTCAAFLLFAADSLGRRRSLLWTSIAQGSAMFVIGFYIRFKPPVQGEPIPGVGYFALACIFLFAAFFQFGWGPCCWIIVSEIPTARLRAMNVALAAATQWLFNFVVAQAVPHMMETVGEHGYGTYFIFGSFCFGMFFYVWFLIPETKGLSLERMDDIFGVTEMAKAVAVGDEEHGRRPKEKTAHTEVIENTASPRLQEQTRDREVQI
ncbi:probable transporter (major facilitator superfamily) [Rhynchosporium agropyri]|uniref:Probable transporter (Major facilitator superfamily) n=2 Tax=Rhynchosporium TaxID=38037 RepID=A0A1E1K4Q9_9HELO|nr:probable transporter (major facilitator superfamily) [Rhynchosporium agropyri]CZT05463.1 probable transporter (major facilitator superfamily) [Rhynchosporium commune]